PTNKEATESSHREPWPANAGALSVRGNEAKPRVIRQNEDPGRACDVGAPRAGSREPSGVGDTKGYVTGAPFRKLTGAPKGSSRNVRHEQPIGHSFLKMPDHGCLGSWDRDRQRLACGRSELNDVGAVILRPVDHDPVLAARRSTAHLRRSFDQSSSASRFTAGTSDDLVRGLDFPGAWVKHSPPKRLRNASAVAVSGKQNRI